MGTAEGAAGALAGLGAGLGLVGDSQLASKRIGAAGATDVEPAVGGAAAAAAAAVQGIPPKESMDIIEATENVLDLNRYMASVRSCGSGGSELASLVSSVDKNHGGFPLLGESLAAHGNLVEGALHRISTHIRQKWKVARIALVVRLGVATEGELSLIIAVSANRWRDAIDAAQYASIEIKDKLAASIAPQCLGKEPKAAAALAAVAAAAGKTAAEIMGVEGLADAEAGGFGSLPGSAAPSSEPGNRASAEPKGVTTSDEGAE